MCMLPEKLQLGTHKTSLHFEKKQTVHKLISDLFEIPFLFGHVQVWSPNSCSSLERILEMINGDSDTQNTTVCSYEYKKKSYLEQITVRNKFFPRWPSADDDWSAVYVW